MICPKCLKRKLQVYDVRNTSQGTRRRRSCPRCGYVFSTVEIPIKDAKVMRIIKTFLIDSKKRVNNMLIDLEEDEEV